MKSALRPEHYFSQETFRQEEEKLFSRLWIFACFKSAVDADQAFATRRIGGRNILVQNTGGQIKAFENSCPHRLMPIQSAAFGQSKMICPYHGWVFDDKGLVKTIPKEQQLFKYCDHERSSLGLHEFAIEIVGSMIFVNLGPSPISITEQFSSELLTRLSEISEFFGDISVHQEIPVNYNWKLNFENVLDHQHIPYVHPISFQPLVIKSKADGDTSNVKHPLPSAVLSDQSWFSTTAMRVQAWPWHEMVTPYGPKDTYHNHFLFPNVNFISVGGLVFLVQQFEPISATQTVVNFSLCAAKPKKRITALPAILRGHLKGEVQVLMEDVAHLENLQSSFHSKSRLIHHGEYEHRLVGFGQAYLRLLEELPN
jgi:phenylpropionate dioxygenase-like ring-hydroxylating dioxygenase large terminal subunit